MITAGLTVESPITHSRTTFLKTDKETDGMGWLLEVRTQPGAPADITEHFHTDWTETFEIISGTAYYKLDGVQKTAQAGEKFVVNPRQLHMHPWCAGQTEMVYRQSDQFARRDPAAVQDVLGVFVTIAKLAAQGKVDGTGRPKDPLQMAATLRTLVKYGGYDSSISPGVQDFIAATLGRLAEALGYRAVHPEWIKE